MGGKARRSGWLLGKAINVAAGVFVVVAVLVWVFATVAAVRHGRGVIPHRTIFGHQFPIANLVFIVLAVVVTAVAALGAWIYGRRPARAGHRPRAREAGGAGPAISEAPSGRDGRGRPALSRVAALPARAL